ncbi:hypothetical protein FHN83_11600 [Leclercia adecarboxylata]|nr:hypothetical protein FHN83_11600 [Leclercia adecarboxylata]
MKVRKPVWSPDWLFLWFRFTKSETKTMFYYFVIYVTKRLIGEMVRSRLRFVMNITKLNSKNIRMPS